MNAQFQSNNGYNVRKAAALFKAWNDAKATMATFGYNAARKAAVDAAYIAYVGHLDDHEELYTASALIASLAANIK